MQYKGMQYRKLKKVSAVIFLMVAALSANCAAQTPMCEQIVPLTKQLNKYTKVCKVSSIKSAKKIMWHVKRRDQLAKLHFRVSQDKIKVADRRRSIIRLFERFHSYCKFTSDASAKKQCQTLRSRIFGYADDLPRLRRYIQKRVEALDAKIATMKSKETQSKVCKKKASLEVQLAELKQQCGL